MSRVDALIEVAILFHEKIEQTLECLASVDSAACTIHVLSNGSSRASRARLDAYARQRANIRVHDAARNLGVAGGRNALLAHTQAPWILFLDNDIVVRDSDWPARLRRHILAEPEVEVFVPRLFQLHDDEHHEHTSFAIRDGDIHSVPLVDQRGNKFPGGAALVRRSLFERNGLYDDQLFVGFEDFEFAVRALRNGQPIRARFIDDVELVHEHRPARTPLDRAAVRARYDHAHIARSHRHLEQRHGLRYPCNYAEWLDDQLTHLLMPTPA